MLQRLAVGSTIQRDSGLGCVFSARITMRSLPFLLTIVTAASLAGCPALAQSADPALCDQPNITSDQRIASCSVTVGNTQATPQQIAYALTERGWAYEDRTQHDRAMSDLNEALRLDPNSAKAWRVRGELYRRAHQLDQAMADF